MEYYKVGQEVKDYQHAWFIVTLIFVTFAAFVETDKVCYSNGSEWQTTAAEGYTDVSGDFNHVMWGLAITCALAGLNRWLGIFHIGYFIWIPYARYSDAGQLCAEHVLTTRGKFIALYFLAPIISLASLCLTVCFLLVVERRC